MSSVMLNTGLALRHPFDSCYSMYRCFLMSNQGVPPAEIKKELIRLTGKKALPREGYLVALVECFQQQYCNLNGITYIPAARIPFKVPIRNCASCAQIGYHSPIFEWSWLTHCPVHLEPLSDHCPTCRQRWPSLVDMPHRSCPHCGPGHYDIAHLVPTLDSFYVVLSRFHEMERRFNSEPHIRLTTAWHFRFTMNKRDALPPDHAFFASLYCCSHKQERLPLRNLGVRIASAKEHRFLLSEPMQEPIHSQKFLDHQDVLIRKKIARRIRLCIAAHRKKPLERPQGFNIEYEGINQNTDCYLYAYIYWSGLVNEPYSAGKSYRRASRYFDIYGQSQYPMIPCPMAYVETVSASENEQIYKSTVISKISIPLGLRNLIYEIDLWMCFKCILKYFDVLKGVYESFHKSAFYEKLPLWAHPGANYADGLSLYWGDAETLVLVVPRAYYSLTLDDLALRE